MDRKTLLAVASVCLAIIMMAPTPALAEITLAGHDAVAQANANLRDNIPGVLVNSQVLDIIQAGERVYVNDEKDIVGVTKTDQWLFVKVYSSGKVGWVYNGALGGPLYFEASSDGD